MRELQWAYGVTTVPERIKSGLLRRTLDSLRDASFKAPRLFVDGLELDKLAKLSSELGLEISGRFPLIRSFGNWILGFAELWIRNPQADRFAMFQDDFVTYKNLMQYLNRVPYPDKGYLNLYTFPCNQNADAFWSPPLDARGQVVKGFYEARTRPDGQTYYYHGKKQQLGRGGVALVFDRAAVLKLLTSHDHIVEKPLAAGDLSWRSIDGAVVDAMNKLGWREYVHNPSLVQHTGMRTTMKSKKHKLAPSFRGTEFDALELLR